MDEPQRRGDSVQQFKTDLRSHKAAAGEPPISELATLTGISGSTLSAALSEKNDDLPSPRTLKALLAAQWDLAEQRLPADQRPLERDETSWLRRRASLVEASASMRGSDQEAHFGPLAASPGREHPRRRARRLRSAVACFGLAAMAFAGGYVLGQHEGSQAVQADQGGSGVRDGEDPEAAGCVPDAVTFAERSVKGIGRLQLVYSARCNAFWARLQRLDDRPVGGSLNLRVFEADEAGRFQSAVEPDTSSAYTAVLVQTHNSERFCASGVVISGETRVAISDRVC